MGRDFVGYLCMMFPMIQDYLLTNSGVSGVTGVFKFFFFAYVVGARQRVKVWKIPEWGTIYRNLHIPTLYIYIITIDLVLNS